MRIRSSEITPKALYLRRREFLSLGAAGAGALLFAAYSIYSDVEASGTPVTTPTAKLTANTFVQRWAAASWARPNQ